MSNIFHGRKVGPSFTNSLGIIEGLQSGVTQGQCETNGAFNIPTDINGNSILTGEGKE